MTTTTKPETTTAERVDELVREGKTKGDAYAAVAKERSLPVSSVRGAYYRANKQSTNGKAPKPPLDPTAAAVAMFRAAIATGSTRRSPACRRARTRRSPSWRRLKQTAGERKAEYEAKIAALA